MGHTASTSLQLEPSAGYENEVRHYDLGRWQRGIKRVLLIVSEQLHSLSRRQSRMNGYWTVSPSHYTDAYAIARWLHMVHLMKLLDVWP